MGDSLKLKPRKASKARSVLGGLLGAALLWLLGAAHVAAWRQALVAQNAQGFDFRTLAVAAAVLQDFDVARAGHTVFADFLFLWNRRAKQHQQLANVLNRRGIELVRQGLEHVLAAGPVVRQNTDFDQAVGIERTIDFFLDAFCQTVGANHDNRVEVVRISAVIFALGRGEDYFGHGAIIDATAITLAPSPSAGDNRGMKVKTQSKKVNKAWLNDHVNDTYVKLAKQEGYRARAAYKIKEIDDTLGLIKPGYCVVDLGSTPGAWSQYVRRKLSPVGAAVGALNGQIIALDLLPMDPVEGVVFIQGDFREDAVLSQLEQALDKTRKVDVVISDMAPNLSGIGAADAARISHLVELAVEFAQKHLKSDGALVVKLFHGDGYSDLVKLFKSVFRVVKPIKPKASRPGSSETFLIGMGLKDQAAQAALDA